MKIYRLASFKEKVQRYNVTDPFLSFFLQKYENLIPWDQIRSPDDINSYIVSSLIPSLYSKIDIESDSNNYLKEIDLESEFRQNPQDPQVQQAWAIYKQDPDTAKKTILDAINSQKKRIFDSWWNYFTKGNDIYSQNPAFTYSILKPIFDKSQANNKRSTMPLNEMAVASLYQKIINEGGKEPFRVDKQYAKEVNIANQSSAKTVPGTVSKDGNGWIRIPSKSNDPSNFDANVDKLIGYSVPNGWCTGSGMAVPYLSKGDFYLYIVDGKAEVAIRMIGDRLGEIQGERNRAPFAYTEEIEEFLKAKGINPSNDYHYKELMEAKQLNENIHDPNKYKELIVQITEEPGILDQLSMENRKNPKVLQDVARAIDIGIRVKNNEPNYVSLSEVVHYYEAIPDDIRLNILPETFEFVVQSVLRSLDSFEASQSVNKKDILFRRLDSIPPEILRENRVNLKLQNVVGDFIEKEPWRVYSLKEETLSAFPSDVIERVKENPVSKTIEELRNSSPNINPEEIIAGDWNEPEIRDYQYWDGSWLTNTSELEYKQALKSYQEGEQILREIDISDIREIDEVREALVDAWQKYIQEDLSRFESEAMSDQREYTDYYKEEPENIPGYNENIRMLAEDLWHARILNDPRELDYAPEDVRYNYDENPYDEEDRSRHRTGLWLQYLINGHLDEINDNDAKYAIEQMSPDQLNTLVNAIISQKNDIDDIDFSEMSPFIQKMVYDYGISLERKRQWEQLHEQGQQELPFYSEISPNDYRIDEVGNVIPIYKGQQGRQASFISWYRFGKYMQIMTR
ncbi:MAG: hypothetical protein WC119_02455 [Synergistaceae bacterium]